MRTGSRWRVLLSPPASGVENMALDEALLARARGTGETVLRVYTWSRPTLSLGRHQRARGRYRPDVLHDRCIDVVRRPTGGRAVLHHREITYSVTAPCGAAQGLRESYGSINRLLMAGLRALGMAVRLAAPRGPEPNLGDAPCFDTPAAGELVWRGRKLVGSAQWRERGALLQHGSILIHDDQSLLSELLACPTQSGPPPATLFEVLGRSPTALELAEALLGTVREVEDSDAELVSGGDLLDADLERLAARARLRYLNDDWTWRL